MQYGVSLHSIGGFLSTRSIALIGRGWPTIPILPVWSMTTSANEPPRLPCVCQKGTVIEQSEEPMLHSVIHSSDLNVSSPAVGAGTTNWAERPRNESNTLRKCAICISGVSPTQPTSDTGRITGPAPLDKSRGRPSVAGATRLHWMHRRDNTGTQEHFDIHSDCPRRTEISPSRYSFNLREYRL